MQVIQKISCPNCGKTAERHYLLSSKLTRTQCGSCDYLMVTCSATGKVIEAYAPGIHPSKITRVEKKQAEPGVKVVKEFCTLTV